MPTRPPVPFDRSKMRIALRRSALAHDSRRPRRNDHIGLGVTSRNFIVDHFGVVGSITSHRRDRTIDLIKQVWHRRDVADFVALQSKMRNHICRINELPLPGICEIAVKPAKIG